MCKSETHVFVKNFDLKYLKSNQLPFDPFFFWENLIFLSKAKKKRTYIKKDFFIHAKKTEKSRKRFANLFEHIK